MADTLGAWIERPTEIPEADLDMRFRRARENWLVFWRPYRDRAPDWLTVDLRTGQVTRFVEVSEHDVRAALQTSRPAPNQFNFAERWGRETSGLRGRAARPGTPEFLNDMVNSIFDATMPVYGLDTVTPERPGDQEFALLQMRSGGSGGPQAITSVSLAFAKPGETATGPLVEVSSEDAVMSMMMREYGGPQPDHGAATTRLFRQFRKSATVPERDDATRTSRQLMLAGTLVHGEFWTWPQTPDVVVVHIARPDVLVTVAAINLKADDLDPLVAQLVPLQTNPAIVAQYRRDLAQRRSV